MDDLLIYILSLGDRSLATTLQKCRFGVGRVGDIKKSKNRKQTCNDICDFQNNG